jgi:non-lysosomal glucosylceramidase
MYDWPVLKHYDSSHLRRIAMPIGGIGTGTVSLGGRGDLRDWELMNRPSKGFVPRGASAPFFALNLQMPDGGSITRALEGPLDLEDYEGAWGSQTHNHGLPRFRQAEFTAAYPLGQVFLSDPALPVAVTLQAFNPFVPANADDSGLPVAALRYLLTNRTDQTVRAAVCGSLPNFIGMNGTQTVRNWSNQVLPTGASGNRNLYHQSAGIQGIFMKSEGVDPAHEAWGTLALTTPATAGVSWRTTWKSAAGGWGSDLLGFWDDFSADGRLDELPSVDEDMPMASLAVQLELPPGETRAVTFLLTWHFPNRPTWTLSEACVEGVCAPADRLVNYYAVQFADAWDAAERIAPRLEALEAETLRFVRAFCQSDLPEPVKEAALFNVSTLRSQTCFRTAEGRFYAWEGCGDQGGCCHGSCTHVWNYEQATAFLFGELSMTMRYVEFALCTGEDGLMSFRAGLPEERSHQWIAAAADGQMGCIMKLYRDWQLSGDEAALRKFWPRAKKALEFCWVKGGWDADRDGVMEGCQHNTMDVEYYGPNPQMQGWYLGALRATEEMALHLGDTEFAAECRRLFTFGKQWMDEHLFNGEYYIQEVRPIPDMNDIYPGLLVGMGARNLEDPDYQLGPGCLIDQLVGQYMAHVCGLGYLHDPTRVRITLQSIRKYNRRVGFWDHFNCMRSFVLGDESALLMAAYPYERPRSPFSYFSEVMTGFEYTAAVGMLYEGLTDEGLESIADVRNRYDGRKRSPFDEAECGHHYARAMAAWAAGLALTGFHYSAVSGTMTFKAQEGTFFWSTGYAYGTCRIRKEGEVWQSDLQVLGGKVDIRKMIVS